MCLVSPGNRVSAGHTYNELNNATLYALTLSPWDWSFENIRLLSDHSICGLVHSPLLSSLAVTYWKVQGYHFLVMELYVCTVIWEGKGKQGKDLFIW